MAGMAKVMIVGNLGRDPEMRYTPSGTAVTNFSVATSRRWTDREGQQREETQWFNVDCWGKLAETANQFLSKGRQVFIEGRISLDEWDDRNTGEKRARLKVSATDLVLLGTRGEGGDMEPRGESPVEDLDNMPF
ncbi:MAG TPA: single-stranded DNA-binding protein [Chloroflexota bacterium]|nr:single-stranded DNA-binding protein [Chloroflexota bacterium]